MQTLWPSGAPLGDYLPARVSSLVFARTEPGFCACRLREALEDHPHRVCLHTLS